MKKKHALSFEDNCLPTLEVNFCGKSSKNRVKSLPPVKKPPSIKQLKEDREVKTMKENRKPMSLPSLDSIIDKYCIDMVKIDSKSKMNNFKTPFKGGNCYPEQETSEKQSDKILEDSSSRPEDVSSHSIELVTLLTPHHQENKNHEVVADSTRNECSDFIRKQDNVFCSIYEDDAKNCKEVVLTPPPLSPITAPTSPVDLRKKNSSSIMSPQHQSSYSTLSLVTEQRQDIVIQCDEDGAKTRTRGVSKRVTAVVDRANDEIAPCDRRSGYGGVTRMNSRVKTVGE